MIRSFESLFQIGKVQGKFVYVKWSRYSFDTNVQKNGSKMAYNENY